MQCSCGYSFFHAALSHARGGKRSYESFLVVNDRDFRRFLKLELQAQSCTEEDERQKLIGWAAKYAGSLMQCPECDRWLLITPKGFEAVHLVPERA